MKLKKHIQNLNRIQTSQNRDLKKGVLLDRNERVDYFDEKTFKKITKSISRFSLNATPDISQLYKQLANYHKISASNIYVAQGITEIMSHILFSVVKKEEEVVLMNPTYPMYEVLCKLHNVKFKLWKFNKKLQLDLNEFKKLINNKTKVVFLVNPNLPIEYEFNEKYKKEIYKICKEKNILIVYDEAYYHFGASSEAKKIKKYKNLIVMRTFSKAWGLPGIRLGYMISDKKICEYISKCRSLVETNAFSFQIAQWAMKNKLILKEHVKNVKNGAKFIKKKLKSVNEKFHGGNVTNAIILKLPNVRSTENLREYLRKKKIYIRTKFKSPIDSYIRISLGSPKKLAKFFKEYILWKNKLSKN
tara:strand:+ start:172 stop:1251 length:1080 start_codon:yes stop_codon:yes gene_type:complete